MFATKSSLRQRASDEDIQDWIARKYGGFRPRITWIDYCKLIRKLPIDDVQRRAAAADPCPISLQTCIEDSFRALGLIRS